MVNELAMDLGVIDGKVEVTVRQGRVINVRPVLMSKSQYFYEEGLEDGHRNGWQGCKAAISSLIRGMIEGDPLFDANARKIIEDVLTEIKEGYKIDPRITFQTEEWQERFRKLSTESPIVEWAWIVGNYNGDQDILDHLFNEYDKNTKDEEYE